jgi:hypothetical protein
LKEGSWSTSYRFTISTGQKGIPSLVSPISGSVIRGNSVTLVWTAVESSGITGYSLVLRKGISTSPGNPSQWTKGSYTEVIIPGQSTSSYTIVLQENTKDKPFYWWSVATVNSSGQKGTFPSPMSFSIDNTPPNISAVELVEPVDTTLSTLTPTFTWRMPLTDYQDVVSWTLEYARDIQLQQKRNTITGLTNLSTKISGNYASISYTLTSPQKLTSGTWYWHLSATDAAGNQSGYTIVKSFVVTMGGIELAVHVTDLNGDPIAGATVTMRKDGDTKGKGTTDSTGKITISDLDTGTYSLEVSATGYRSYEETINLSANTNKDVTLYRGAVIHGYVYYNNTQNPAPNVAVRIYEAETELQVVSDVTDTNGYFIVDNVADDKSYYIVVEDYEDQKKQGIVAVDTPTSATSLTIIIKTEGEIIGVIQDEEGDPLPGAKVTLRDDQGQFVNSTSTSNIGSFTFKVTPGKYYVEVTLFGFEDYKGNVFTVEYKEIEDLGLITLHSKSGTLEITVQNEKGELVDATITVRDAAGNVIDTISVTGGTASVEILVGICTLEAHAYGYQLQAATDISIESGGTVFQDFVLTFAPGSLEIYIEDPERMPISGAEISLDGVFSGTTDLTGCLPISNVPPDDHTIRVVREGFADYTDVLTLNPGETLILEITMERTSKMLLYFLLVLIIGAGITAFKYANSISSVILGKKTSSLLFCPHCGNRIGKNWKKCLYCGANLKKTRIYDDDTRPY